MIEKVNTLIWHVYKINIRVWCIMHITCKIADNLILYFYEQSLLPNSSGISIHTWSMIELSM